jgi:hypothetical protein
MTILAGSVRIETHGEILGVQSGGISGSVKITTTGDIMVETGGSGPGEIDVSAPDNPGQIDLVAGGNVLIGGDVVSDATNAQGSGGTINVTAQGTSTCPARSAREADDLRPRRRDHAGRRERCHAGLAPRRRRRRRRHRHHVADRRDHVERDPQRERRRELRRRRLRLAVRG